MHYCPPLFSSFLCSKFSRKQRTAKTGSHRAVEMFERPKGQQMNSDLCDMCGCCGAGGFRGDGLSAQQHPGVCVTVSVDLLISKILHLTFHV